MKTMLKLAMAVGLLTAGAVSAQNYVVQQSSAPYVPLTGAGVMPVPLVERSVSFEVDDEGYFELPLGFTFPYYGQNFTSVHVDSNGFLYFEPAGSTLCHSSVACTTATKFPSNSRTPHNVIAPWWGDLDGNGTGELRYRQGPGEIEIEWSGWARYNGTYTYSVKVKLTASGLFQVHYGTITAGTGTGVGAGFEDSTGTNGAALLACSASNANCLQADFPQNTLFTVGQPVQPDIAVADVSIANLNIAGNGIATFSVTPTFRNFGQNPANNFLWRAYLSTDRTLSPGTDVLVFTASTPVSVAGGGATATATGNAATTAALPPGQYYVLVEADHTNVVTEALETNNVGSTNNYFVNGLDLVATGISGPANTGPGNMINVNATFFNQGTQSAGAVVYRVLLSLDNMASTNDFTLFEGTRAVTGAETVNLTIPITVPQNVPGGEFFYILSIDPLNAIAEASETNNTFAGATKVTVRQADLENLGADFLDPITGASSRTADFGQLARVKVELRNIGGADANNFKVGVVISNDKTLSLLNDTMAYQHTVTQVAQGATVPVDFTFTMPSKDRNGNDFTTGNYFIFVLADSGSAVTEINEGNNNSVIRDPVRLRAPAADLAVTRVEAPASAAVGEVIPVLRTMKNLGNVAAPAAKYRFVASANAIITPDDIPLSIVSGATPTTSGTVTLAVGAADTQTELVRLPPTMAPGTYYLGVLVDTDGVVVELDEGNNALASSTVSVAASSLRVTTQQLPDAVVDRPYSFRLAAAGEIGGASTWSLEPGQGALPMGLSLAADGLITGTPTAAVVSSVTAIVSNSGRDAAARLVIRVLPTTSQVEITTTSVPALVNSTSVNYELSLGAAGGVKPYNWRIVAGALPQNLQLSTSGIVSGSPRVGLTEGPNKVTVEVRDSLGTVAQRELNFRVVAPGSIVFSSPTLPDGLVGANYQTDISVANEDGTPLATPVTFTPSGAIPDGLKIEFQSGLALLSGTPLRAGTFVFALNIEDAKGRADTAEFTVRVYPARFSVKANNLPEVLRPGEQASFTFSTSTGVAAKYTLYSGALPPGLSLTAEGTVAGTIPTEKGEGSYAWVLEATDATGASGLGVFAVDVRREVKAGGCSAAGGLQGLWLLGALVPLALRRRARRFAGVAGLALAVVASSAFAQEYNLDGPKTLPFRPLTGGTTVTNGQSVTLPFNFTFYGTTTNQVGVSHYGYLAFQGTSTYSTNQGIPNTSTSTTFPQAFVAPWWDLFTTCTSPCNVRYQTFDVAPRRYTVFEWGNVAYNTTTARFSFQAILYEGTNQVRFSYGPTAGGAGSASVGIQKQPTVGIAGLTCTTTTGGSCTTANFPTNQVLDFFLPPELVLGAVTGDQTGYAGVTYRASAVIRNPGGRAAANALVRFYLSANATWEASDVAIGDAMPIDVGTVDDVLVTASAAIPSGTAPGNYFLIARIDPDNTVAEQNENNNIGTAFQFTVGMPTADLIVGSVSSPAAGTPAGTVMAPRTLTNAGNAAAGAFKYTWFLSDNAVVTISDAKLFTGSVGGLAATQSDTATDSLPLPGTLNAGKYWLGVCVNYDPSAMPQFGIDEISRVNNCRTASQPIVITSGELSVISTTLPGAAQYSPYGLRLQAAGGDGTYVWSVVGGALPPGMSLSAQGDLLGNPAKAGAFSFEVKVTSGGAEKTQALSLQVMAANLPLAIVDQELPAAEFSRTYQVGLVAVGGKPPYDWKLKGESTLPAGLGLASDGTIEGRPAEAGEFKFSVEVEDSAKVKGSKDLTLRIVTPTSLHIATNALARGYLTRTYLQPLQAVGGRPGYVWKLLKFQQLSETPTDGPGQVISTFDEVTNLSTLIGLVIEDGGNGIKYLKGTPKKAGAFVLTLEVRDENGSTDTTQLTLRISYEDALAITTTALPDAFQGREYSARLSHNGGTELVGIKFQETCVKLSTRLADGGFDCAPREPTNELPDGIVLSPEGALSGTPSVAVGTYSFLVEVKDEAGRTDVRGLAIRVRADYASQKGGCSALAGGPIALLGLGLVTALRRRRAAR